MWRFLFSEAPSLKLQAEPWADWKNQPSSGAASPPALLSVVSAVIGTCRACVLLRGWGGLRERLLRFPVPLVLPSGLGHLRIFQITHLGQASPTPMGKSRQ